MVSGKVVDSDLKFIKKHYGEKFSHLCRELFPTILEQEGLLSKTLIEHFAPTRSLYELAINQKNEFRAYIFEKAGIAQPKPKIREGNKTPKEILDEAGYILYDECQSEKEVQSFKKYYAKGEELCTFNGGRLDGCRVWFAVKKNVDEIKREDFKNPQRQDEYGTSVISIQFTRGDNSTLSIKNRYNHTVKNPDATFSNNLDNICVGLTEAFTRQFGIGLVDDFLSQLDTGNFVLADDGRYYSSSIELNNVHYCEGNVLIDNGHKRSFDKGRYILMDHYLVDLKENKISIYNEWKHKFCNCDIGYCDSFINSLGQIKNISVSKDQDGNKVIIVTPNEGENVEITLNTSNQIIGYKNYNVLNIGKSFLNLNTTLKKFDCPNVKTIADNFLVNNEFLTEINLSNVEEIGSNFLIVNRRIKKINFPNVEKIGDNFLYFDNSLIEAILPSCEEIGRGFLENNKILEILDAKSLKKIGKEFLVQNEELKEIDFPNLREIPYGFLMTNNKIKSIYLPEVVVIGDYFMPENKVLEEISLPKVKNIGYLFLSRNKSLTSLVLLNTEKIGIGFLKENEILRHLELPLVESLPNYFLANNNALTILSLKSAEIIFSHVLENNRVLKIVDLPNVEYVDKEFLLFDSALEKINVPKLERRDFSSLPLRIQEFLNNSNEVEKERR